MGITVLSTGLLLRRHAAELVRRCDDVVVSLDGPQPLHDQIRNIPRAYARLAEGVAAVKAADPRVLVTGRCTVQRANFQHIRATVAAAHELGLDRISFLSADVSSEAFNRPDGWDGERVAQVALEPEDLPLLAAELDALEQEHAADFAAGYIAEPPIKLRRRLHQYYAALLGQGDFYPEQLQRALGLDGDRVRRHRATMLLSAAARQHLRGQQPRRHHKLARGAGLAQRARHAPRRDLPQVRLHAVVAR